MNLEILDINQQNKQTFIDMCDEFYHSSAVLHPIDRKNIEHTACLAVKNSEFVRCLLLELDSIYVGYALLSFTYSNEAGGICLWLEEIYVKDEYRGKGIGKQFFSWLFKTYDNQVARYRLEISEGNDKAEKLYLKSGFTRLNYNQLVVDIEK